MASPQELTVIGPGIRVNGRITGEEDLHVEGRAEGSISLTETLFVASGAVVVADVRARDVVINGVVVGNVTAENSVTLNAGAKLVGDLAAPRVIMAEGAAFRGSVSMGGTPPVQRERARASTTAGRPRQAAAPRSAAAPARPAARAENAPAQPMPTRATVSPRSAPRPPETPARAEAAHAAPPRRGPEATDDEVTVVVRHAHIAPNTDKQAKKTAPRARVPKPGKRRVTRR